jgi:transposase-like protein
VTPKFETVEEVPIFREWRISMRRKYRRWTLAEKRAAVERMVTCRHKQLAAELGISKTLLYSWRKHLWSLEKTAGAADTRERALEREVRQLKEALATKVVEADFLQGVLRRIEAQRRPTSGSGETASTRRSE